MREILFKAKRIANGEWVEGQYVYFENPKTESGEPVKHFIGNGTTIFTDEIDLSTLCQYTGLKDKNGKQIWENDIVLLREEIQNYEWKATVKFGNPNCEYNWGWQLVPIGECDMNKDILLWIDMEIANCEVIGNIFDNPELLGQLKNEVLIKTPEEAIETIKSNMPKSGYQMLRESLDMGIEALKEVQQYREIGTVEECREAAEKQTPRKPDYEGDGYDNKGELIYDTWICPNCGEKYEVDYDDYEHCPKCGQAIQWENLEGMEDEH